MLRASILCWGQQQIDHGDMPFNSNHFSVITFVYPAVSLSQTVI